MSEPPAAPEPERETDAEGGLHYRFPVHITVVGGLGEAERTQLQEEIMESLHRALG